MKTIHATNKIAGAEPDAEPTVIAKIRNWFRKKAGGTGIPISVIDEETKQAVELPVYKYNVDINTGSGVFKVNQEATSEANAKKAVITWYLNNKLLVNPQLLGPEKKKLEKGEEEKWRYKCAITTGTGNLKYLVVAKNAEEAVMECKVWFVRNKLRLTIKLVGQVTKKQDAESGTK